MHRIPLSKKILHIHSLIDVTGSRAPACWGSSRLTTMIPYFGTTFAGVCRTIRTKAKIWMFNCAPLSLNADACRSESCPMDVKQTET
jgi:hypothetical protein